MGVLVGDAAGAPLEFSRRMPTEEEVSTAMAMPGGGVIGVDPGQLTDDGELTAALYWALRPHSNDLAFPIDDVAQAYRHWYQSKPIDCGNTCANAFKSSGTNAWSMMAAAAESALASQGNGALMRMAPIPVWYADKSGADAALAARSDAMLSHQNPACLDCNAMYCSAIHHLMSHSGDYEGALRAAMGTKCKSEAVQWLSMAPADCMVNKGHVKHAFTLAMTCLRRNLGYEDAIRYALSFGGDTDTNAAIVGGAIGALKGISSIPLYMLEPVVNAFTTNMPWRNLRPEEYSARKLFQDSQSWLSA
jgi:ADP-ribosyl-[dinitrogen reductase] hydrolase